MSLTPKRVRLTVEFPCLWFPCSGAAVVYQPRVRGLHRVVVMHIEQSQCYKGLSSPLIPRKTTLVVCTVEVDPFVPFRFCYVNFRRFKAKKRTLTPALFRALSLYSYSRDPLIPLACVEVRRQTALLKASHRLAGPWSMKLVTAG